MMRAVSQAEMRTKRRPKLTKLIEEARASRRPQRDRVTGPGQGLRS